MIVLPSIVGSRADEGARGAHGIDLAAAIPELAKDLGPVLAEAGLRRGCISMPHAFGDNPGKDADARVRSIGSNTGRLTPVERAYDPYTGIPRMSDIPVNVRPYEGALAD